MSGGYYVFSFSWYIFAYPQMIFHSLSGQQGHGHFTHGRLLGTRCRRRRPR